MSSDTPACDSKNIFKFSFHQFDSSSYIWQNVDKLTIYIWKIGRMTNQFTKAVKVEGMCFDFDAWQNDKNKNNSAINFIWVSNTWQIKLSFQASASVEWRDALCTICITYSLLHAGFLRGLFFGPENEDNTFLQNIDWLWTEYVTLYPRK
jgi:hypothetical protein